MKIKSVLTVIIALGALLLVLSLTAVGKVSGAIPRDVLAGSQSQPQIAQILPKRSPIFWSLLVKPQRLGLLAKLAAKPRDRAEVSEELHKLKQQLSQNWLLDYGRDVQPWLDQEVSLAVTSIDLDDQPSNGLQTGYLLAFAIQDGELAKSKINRFWQKLVVDGKSVEFEQYRGLPILSVEIAKGRSHAVQTIAQTITDKFVLFANDRRVLQQVIDTINSSQSAIADLASYQDSLPKFGDRRDGRFGFAYANLEFGDLIKSQIFEDTALPRSQKLIPDAMAPSVKDLGAGDSSQNVLISFNLDKSGIRLKTASASLSQSVPIPFKDIVNKLPAESSVVFGRNLPQTLQSSEKTLPSALKKYLTKTLSPIPLDSRVWSWVKGDYAIASIPNSSNSADWLLVGEAEKASTKAAVAELDNLFRSKFTIGEIRLKQQPVTIWTNLSAIADDRLVSGNIAIAHTQTPEYIYFSNSLPVLESTLSLKPSKAIASSKDFRNTISQLAKGQSTYAYLHKEIWQQWQQEIPLTSSLSPIIESSPLPLISKHLNLIGIAGDNTLPDLLNAEIFLQLN
ncbi:MAG: hypothetical protein AUK48_10895 [Oscillatoriales cyanobacterium CG2_30_44_21]|nr:MAG: hypothetical protein AUK48_10895 [Oscillatoriales cyanobacterium CG2_30_44_21]